MTVLKLISTFVKQLVIPCAMVAAVAVAGEITIGSQMGSIEELFSKAKSGDPAAQKQLGNMYYQGTELPRDPVEAVKWFRLAADQGFAAALCNLGATYLEDDRVPLDLIDGIRLTHLAAERGVPAAQMNLGTAYRSGKGVVANDEEGYRLIGLAATQGYTPAQYYLGEMYFSSKPAEAAKLFLKAANQCDADAQSRLGFMYEHGRAYRLTWSKPLLGIDLLRIKETRRPKFILDIFMSEAWGVEKDYLEAMRLYRAAADRGCTSGCTNIVLLYAFGQGVPENKVLAYVLLTFLEAPELVDFMRQTSSSLESSLSCNEFVTAKRLAYEFAQGTEVSRKIDAYLKHPYLENDRVELEQGDVDIAAQKCATTSP
jgi:TPR repeat protein